MDKEVPPHVRSLLEQYMNTLGDAFRDPTSVNSTSILVSESLARELKNLGIPFEVENGILFEKQKQRQKTSLEKKQIGKTQRNLTHILYELNHALLEYYGPEMIDSLVKEAAEKDPGVQRALDALCCFLKRPVSLCGCIHVTRPAEESKYEITITGEDKLVMKEMKLRMGTRGNSSREIKPPQRD